MKTDPIECFNTKSPLLADQRKRWSFADAERKRAAWVPIGLSREFTAAL
jgi:hypothetical protein